MQFIFNIFNWQTVKYACFFKMPETLKDILLAYSRQESEDYMVFSKYFAKCEAQKPAQGRGLSSLISLCYSHYVTYLGTHSLYVPKSCSVMTLTPPDFQLGFTCGLTLGLNLDLTLGTTHRISKGSSHGPYGKSQYEHMNM